MTPLRNSARCIFPDVLRHCYNCDQLSKCINMQAQEAGERECMEVATMLSEVDRRIAETKKDMYEFKRDIIGRQHQYYDLLTLLLCITTSCCNVALYAIRTSMIQCVHVAALHGSIWDFI